MAPSPPRSDWTASNCSGRHYTTSVERRWITPDGGADCHSDMETVELTCEGCGAGMVMPGRELRGIPVERGDAQAFQVRDSEGAVRQVIFACPRCAGFRARVTKTEESDWTRQRLTSIKVFDDPTPTGQINCRIIKAPVDAFEATQLTEEQKEQLLRLLLLCGKKLVAVYRHLQDFARIEDGLIERVQKEAAQGAGGHRYLEHSQELMIEFDEFLVQLKSSLDYLVKIPVPIFGPRVWSLQTFGEKGEKVVKALKQNLPGADRSRAKFLADYVIQKSKPWLTAVIEARDRFNHLIGGTVVPEQFMVYAVKNAESGIVELRRPMWSPDQSVRAFMEVVWDNLIRFFEDFTFGCLQMRLRERLTLFHGLSQPGSNVSPWKLTTEEVMERVTRSPGWIKA